MNTRSVCAAILALLLFTGPEAAIRNPDFFIDFEHGYIEDYGADLHDCSLAGCASPSTDCTPAPSKVVLRIDTHSGTYTTPGGSQTWKNCTIHYKTPFADLKRQGGARYDEALRTIMTRGGWGPDRVIEHLAADGVGYDLSIWDAGTTSKKVVLFVEGIDIEENTTWGTYFGELLMNSSFLVKEFKPTGTGRDTVWRTDESGNRVSFSFLPRLLAAGHDVMFLNFANSTQAIDRNMLAVRAALDTLRDRPAAFYPQTAGVRVEDVVVVGASMGGLVSRAALSYMEAHDEDHGVRLFVSFDSPQQGANVPLGIQYFTYFMDKGGYRLGGLKPGVSDIFNKACVKQMLVYHYDHRDASGSLLTNISYNEGLHCHGIICECSGVGTIAGSRVSSCYGYYSGNWGAYRDRIVDDETMSSDDFRRLYQRIRGEWGDYPKRLRKVAITNGSVDGTLQRNGTSVLDGSNHIMSLYGAFRNVDLFSTPADQGTTGNIITTWNGVVALTDKDEYFTCPIKGLRNYDGAPGSWRPEIATIASKATLLPGIVTRGTAYHDHHSFIPTTSALDIRDPANPSDRVDLRIDIVGLTQTGEWPNFTPFDDICAAWDDPSANRKHDTVTIAQAQFLLREILSGGEVTVEGKTIGGKECGLVYYSKRQAPSNGTTVSTKGEVVMEAGANVAFRAEKKVRLRSGFKALRGSRFTAAIGDGSAGAL